MKNTRLKDITDILFSYQLMLILLTLLGIGAGIATFIENDYGSATARVEVYNHIWYESVMFLSIVNLTGIIFKRKMYKSINGRFVFHISFIFMLLGAGLTRYAGHEGILHVREGKSENRMISLEPYLQVTINHNGKIYYNEYQFELSRLGNSFSYDIKFDNKKLHIKYADYAYNKQNRMPLLGVHVSLDSIKKTYKLVGGRGMQGYEEVEKFGDTEIKIAYGSKILTLPFSIKLRDFQLDRYPGSMSPSSYASEVTLIDEENSKEFDYRIFMNNTLKYGNYQFFQSSYDQDELGTILSVNVDPGKWPTYFSYFLLTLGLVMSLFDKKSRFMKLTRYIKSFNSIAIILLATLFLNSNLKAESTEAYLANYKKDSFQTAQKFGLLVTQSNMGRMKPVYSLNREILSKLTRRTSFMGMNANQVLLGMLSRPQMWQAIEMIKIKTPKLKKLLGVEKTRKYLAFNDIFDSKGAYKLKDLVEKANTINPNKRGTFEKDIIKVDERLNVAYMVFYGNLLNIFPKPNDATNKWYNPMEAMKGFEKKEKEYIQELTVGLIDNTVKANYKEADKFLDKIAKYQDMVGSDVIPSKSLIESEILFNDLDIFFKLTLIYVGVGFILLILSFTEIFSNKKFKKVNMIFFAILSLLFVMHTAGMAHRWYISGHAPWSDTYESLVYIAWSAMFAGLFFFRKSNLALSATVIMAGVFMFTAHLTGIDPQITTLVPVLKSFWLTIHVSIITGSYGFLAIGAMLGFMSLFLFLFRNQNRGYIDQHIKQITAITEASLIVGLAMLIVGNFLGGVWANESWGRYWGWDPKETWAWVSILVYVLVVHLRFVPKLDTPYVFSVASTLAFSAILMTYFGVNFYLSGMHSYATGDPVPIPTWVYILTCSVFIVIGLAYRKRDLGKIRFN